MPASRAFPRRVAVFNDRFIFTTLTEKEVTQAGLVPFHHPTTLKACSLFTCESRSCAVHAESQSWTIERGRDVSQ